MPGGRPRLSKTKRARREERKPTERTKVLKAISEKALMEGAKPIEVMLENMRYYHNKAERLMKSIEERVTNGGLRGEQLKEVVADLKEMNGFRDKATAHASQAAPYVHPRLSAVAVSGKVEHRHALPEDLPLVEAMRVYEENARRFPKTIEHEPEEIPLKEK